MNDKVFVLSEQESYGTSTIINVYKTFESAQKYMYIKAGINPEKTLVRANPKEQSIQAKDIIYSFEEFEVYE